MRLAKYLAHAGVASRRAAERIVAEGRVAIAGTVVRDPARDVDDDTRVTVDGRAVAVAGRERVVYAVHKPAGVVSTAHDTHRRATVVDLVDADERLYPVGRLDADSTGLILLTNDGELAHALTHPSFEVGKTYRARVRNGPVREPALRALRQGIELEDGLTAPAQIRRIGSAELELTIHEGRKRQVRRMLEAVDHPVIALQRVAFGPLRLGGLAEGSARRLKPGEVEQLREATAGGPASDRREAPGRGRPDGRREAPGGGRPDGRREAPGGRRPNGRGETSGEGRPGDRRAGRAGRRPRASTR